jgi:hypothetical protein
MRCRPRLILVLVVIVGLLAVAPVTYAVQPNIELVNRGVIPQVPTAATPNCEYTARAQLCLLELSNKSAFEVTITKTELNGPEEQPPPEETRYQRLKNGCTVGTSIAAGKNCTLELERRIGIPCPQMNGYAIRAEETGNPANQAQANAFLKAK